MLHMKHLDKTLSYPIGEGASKRALPSNQLLSGQVGVVILPEGVGGVGGIEITQVPRRWASGSRRD